MKTHSFLQKNRKRLMINSLGDKKDLPKKSLFLDFQTNLYYPFLKKQSKRGFDGYSKSYLLNYDEF